MPNDPYADLMDDENDPYGDLRDDPYGDLADTTAPKPQQVQKFKQPKTPEEIEKYIEEQTIDPTLLYTNPIEYGKKFGEQAYRLWRQVPIIGPATSIYGRKLDEAVFGADPDRPSFEEEEALYEKKFPQKAAAEKVIGGLLGPTTIGKAGQVFKGAQGVLGRGAQALGNVGLRAGAAGGEAAIDAALRGDISPEDAFGYTGGAVGALDLISRSAPVFYRSVVRAIPYETIQKYKANPDAINAADSVEIAKAIREAVEGQKGIQRNLAEEFARSKTTAKSAEKGLERKLKGVQPPYNLPDEIIEDAKDLRASISKASSESFDILKNEGVPVPTRPILKKLVAKARAYDFGGKEPELTEFKQARSKLIEVARQIQNLGAEADPIDVKRVIQKLDAITENAYQTQKFGGYVPVTDRVLIEVRGDLNDSLMEIPEYARVMKPLREATELSKNLNKVYQNPQSIGKKLRRLGEYDQREDQKILEELSKLTGNDYIKKLEPYRQAQRSLESPQFEELVGQLPASQRSAKLEADFGALKDSNEYLKKLNTPKNVIRNMTRKDELGKFETEEALQQLAQRTGKDFTQDLDYLATKEAMERPFLHGSRGVNMSAFSVAGIAGLASRLFGIDPTAAISAGAMMGAQAGGWSDLFGSKAVKFMLDVQRDPKFKHLVGGFKNAYYKGPKTFMNEVLRASAQDENFRQYLESKAAAEEQMMKGMNK